MRLLTPPGVAGVACVAAAPAERKAVLACLRAPSGAPLALRPGAPPARACLRLADRPVDDVLAVDRGESGVELHLHGSPAVLELLRRHFAFEVEAPSPARRLLRTALSVEQLDLALEQLGFDFEAMLAELDAAVPPARLAALAAVRERSRVALALAGPQRVVLVGAQNAGKSTLFNRLLFRERVLTGDLPGLTRDPVAEVTTLQGYPYELVDTAGMGEFASVLDARAFAAGQRLRQEALVVLVVDAARGPTPIDRALLAAQGGVAVVVANKADLPAWPWPADLPTPLSVSCATQGAAELRANLGARLRACRGLPPAGPVGGPAALDAAQWARLAAL